METWSSSVTTTFQVPNPSNNPSLTHHRLKPTPLSHHHSAAPKTTATSSTYRPTSPKKDNFTPLYSSHPRKPSSAALPLLGPNFRAPRASVHSRAASGYAAALLDVAQSNGVVLEVGRDVRRLLRLLRNGQVKELMLGGFMEEREKGEVVVELVERGKFEGHLVGLVKLVIAKGKSVEIVKEALEEFERVFYHLAPVPVPAPALAT